MTHQTDFPPCDYQIIRTQDIDGDAVIDHAQEIIWVHARLGLIWILPVVRLALRKEWESGEPYRPSDEPESPYDDWN